jgi:hypothetical protein
MSLTVDIVSPSAKPEDCGPENGESESDCMEEATGGEFYRGYTVDGDKMLNCNVDDIVPNNGVSSLV